MKLPYLLLATFVISTQLFAQTGTGAIPCSSSAVSPHIAFGGGWSTTIYISVDADTDQTITLSFLDSRGKPLQAPISSTSGLSGRVSEIPLRIRKGTEAVELLGTDAQLSVGWAVATCSGAIKPQIFEVFRSNVPGRPEFEASVPFTDVPLVTPNVMVQGIGIPNRFTPSALPELDLKQSVSFPFDSRNGLETGIGVVNPVAPVSATKVGIQCYSGSALIGQKPNLLEESTAYGAWLLSSIIPATIGQVGFCKVYGDNLHSQAPIILALRFTQGGAFSMIPVRTSTEAVTR